MSTARTAFSKGARHRTVMLLALAGLAVGVAACGGGTAELSDAADTGVVSGAGDATEGADRLADIEVVDAWVRAPAMGQQVAAAYVTIANGGDAAVTLTAVSSPLAVAELHETVDEGDGVMRMRERTAGFEIAAGDELVMAPGGAHIMLLDIDRLAVVTAGEVPLTLDFDGAGFIEVTAPVRDDLADDMHGDMHDDMHDEAHGEMHDEMHDEMHGGDSPDAAGDDEAGEMVDPGPPDPHLLHDLDDELHAGVFDQQRQLAMVATFRASLDHAAATGALPADFDLETMTQALDDLEAALVAGDVELAAQLAFEAHDIAHGLGHH